MNPKLEELKTLKASLNITIDKLLKFNLDEIEWLEIISQIKLVSHQTENASEYLENIYSIKLRNIKLIEQLEHNIISLGDNCLPRNIMTKYGLKRTKSKGELTYPFDLSIHPASSVSKLISTSFKDYFDPEQYSIEYGHPINKELGIMFNHERDSFFRENNYAQLIARYEKRSNNFTHALDNEHNIFVLHCSSISGISELLESIRSRNNSQDNLRDNHLIVIYTGKPDSNITTKFLTLSDDKLKIHWINAPLPYQSYCWFKIDDFIDKRGLDFETKIIERLERIIIKINRDRAFTTTNLSLNTIENSKENISYLKKILSFLDENIIDKIKKDCSRNGFNSHLKACDYLDEMLLSKVDEIDLEINLDLDITLFNFSFVFSKVFVMNFGDYAERLLKLDFHTFKKLLCRVDLVILLCDTIIKNVSYSIEPIKILSLALAVTTFRLKNSQEEIEFLTKISTILNSQHNENSELIFELISMRIKTLGEVNITNANKGRIALIISGQLRGYKEALPSLAKKFDDLSNVDIYVSTWSDIGFTKYSDERLNRIYDEDALDWIRTFNKKSQAESAYNRLCKSSGVVSATSLIKELKEIFVNSGQIRVNIKDDSEYPYNKMSNSEKMFFHNSYWLNSLPKIDWHEYSQIIKIRPDLYFPDNDQKFENSDFDNCLYTEDNNGWIYREWGFGVGDQLIYGPASLMKNALLLHGENIYSRITSLLNSSGTSYLGHVNCGLYAWANSKDCKQTKVIPSKLCTLKKLSVPDIENEEINY